MVQYSILDAKNTVKPVLAASIRLMNPTDLASARVTPH
jgi:hypothetical protein